MIKKTPEGLVYVAKILITNRIFSMHELKFFDYEKIILLDNNNGYLNKIKENFKIFINYKDIVVENAEDKDINNLVKKANIIYNLEKNNKRDKLKVLASNFNQVLAKEFLKRNIVLGICIDSLKDPKLIARIRQNLIIARHFKVPVIVSLFESQEKLFGWYEAMHLLRTLL